VAAGPDSGLRRLVLPAGRLTLGAASRLEREALVIADDPAARVVLVAGADDDLCPGFDPGWEPLGSGIDPAAAIAGIRCPVVALLRGRVWSAGLEIALACDLRISAADVTFALPELAAGRLPCWGATQRLPRIAGLPAAMLLLAGEPLAATDPAAAALAGEVVEVGATDAAADALVAALLQGAPLALELCKEAIHAGSELPMRRALELEGDLNHLLQSTSDRAEGLAAFAEKRPPRFEGR
jgi:enoyl-CoA hydratase/carnithine racemase